MYNAGEMMSLIARPWRWPERVWLLLLFAILLARFPIHFMIWPPYLMDFEVYRAVAERLIHGHAVNLYAPTTSDAMLFKYSPCWALLWIPLAWLTPQAGAVVWATIGVLAFIWGCWLAQRVCVEALLPAPPWSALMVVTVLVRPLTEEFLNGQVNLLWGVLVMSFLLAMLRQRSWWAAIWLALAISLKLPAAIFLPYLFFRGQWKLLAQAGVALLALHGATSLLLVPAHPWQLLTAWYQVLRASGPARAFEIGNQSLLALLGRFLSADPHHLNMAALSLGWLGVLALILSGMLFMLVLQPVSAALSWRQRIALDGSLLITLMVLASPTTWVPTYSVLILPVVIASGAAINRLHRHRSDLAAWLSLFGMLILSFMTHSGFWRAIGIHAIRGETYVFMVLMILPWLGLFLFAVLWHWRHDQAGVVVSIARTSGN